MKALSTIFTDTKQVCLRLHGTLLETRLGTSRGRRILGKLNGSLVDRKDHTTHTRGRKFSVQRRLSESRPPTKHAYSYFVNSRSPLPT